MSYTKQVWRLGKTIDRQFFLQGLSSLEGIITVEYDQHHRCKLSDHTRYNFLQWIYKLMEPKIENWKFPTRFGEIFINSLKCYKQFFAAYVTLSFLSFLPFILINLIAPVRLLDVFEVIHGNILDIIIFLTLPTLFIDKKVFPLATLSVFKGFIAAALLISLLQFATLLFFVIFFIQINIALVFFGFIPYVFLIFSGYFLILNNIPNILNAGRTLMQSLRLVGQSFLPVILGVLNISLVMLLPISIFSFWYFGNHPDMAQFSVPDGFDTTNDARITENFFQTFQIIAQEDPFQAGRIGIHILFRPLKSLFLAFLFLGILHAISPKVLQGYFTSYKSQSTEKNIEDTDQ